MALEELTYLVGLVCRGIGGIVGIGLYIMAALRAHPAVDASRERSGHLPVDLFSQSLEYFFRLM